MGVAILLATLLLTYVAQPVDAIQAKPATDWSFYVLSMFLGDAQDLGYNQGQYDNANNKNSLVVLDFGGQTFSGGGAEGTQLINGIFASHAQIESYVREFARSWWYGNPNWWSQITIAVGTNNSISTRRDYGGGQAWANVINSLNAYVINEGWGGQIFVVGASDIEPDFGAPGTTKDWVRGYDDVTTAQLVNFGSADGCPDNASNGAPCNNGWDQEDIWWVSWGTPAGHALPEIYYAVNARQWARISEYGEYFEGGLNIYFEGPLDNNYFVPSSNTSQQAWDQLWTEINNNPATASNLKYSVQIHNSQ